MPTLLKTIRAVTTVLVYVCYAAVIVTTVMTVGDVIMRYIFNRPNSGVTEWSQMLLIVSMTAMAHALLEGRFISVGTLVDRFPRKANIAFEVIMGVVSFVFFVVVGWQLIKMVETSIAFKETYFVIKTPRWPMYAILGVSFLATGLATVSYVIGRLTKRPSTHEKNVFDDNPDLAILAFSDTEYEAEKGGGDAQ
ncbi:MAG: TRAP transporter small permease [Clostridiales Family XIII bacterium]|jgi:TRAP-type C4-dicarboxylate transport system permease small subunit|nr:TRAP transporter small permease [Clostridiales Family XIII bacterium]